MDIRLVSDDGDVLRLKAVARIVQGPPLPDPPPIDDLLGPDGYARNVLLSLAELVLMDTMGMSWLLILHKRFCQAGGRLVIHSVRPQVMEFLGIVRFENVLHIAEDEGAAAALLRVGDSAAGIGGPTTESLLVDGADSAGGPTRPSRSVLSSRRRPRSG